MKEVFALWVTYSARRKVIDRDGITNVETFQNGYYSNTDFVLSILETEFLARVPSCSDQLINVLKDQRQEVRRRVAAAYLLGWAGRTNQKAKDALLLALNDSRWHDIHNAAGRSLFPMVQDEKLPVQPMILMLQHSSRLCRNKAAGILAYAKLSRADRYTIKRAAGKVLKKMLLAKPVERAACFLSLQLLGIDK